MSQAGKGLISGEINVCRWWETSPPGGDRVLASMCETGPWDTTGPSPTSYHGSEGVREHDFDLRYCCSQGTVILPIPPSFSMGEELREGREEGFGSTARLAESSQDSSTGFTCLNSSLHGVSLPFTLKIATVCCETLILNASLDCFQKASQNFPSRGITTK